MSDSRILYDAPRANAATPAELAALATIYRRAVERYEEADAKKKSAHPGGPDDAKGGSKHDFRADKAIIPESG